MRCSSAGAASGSARSRSKPHLRCCREWSRGAARLQVAQRTSGDVYGIPATQFLVELVEGPVVGASPVSLISIRRVFAIGDFDVIYARLGLFAHALGPGTANGGNGR